MNISPRDLLAQYVRACQAWPFVHDIEQAHGLPAYTLFAVASRETNMTDEVGDGGHGHGAWQLDDRSHHIPDPFPVRQQADIAASMLVSLHQRFGDWISAFNAYNSGQPKTERTAGHNYGTDVADRLAWLQSNVPAPAPAPNPLPVMEFDVEIANTAKVGSALAATMAGVEGKSPGAGWFATADGGVNQLTDDTPFWGGYFNLPAEARNAPRVCTGVFPRRDRAVGYEICFNDGAYYTMGPGLNGFAT